MYTKVVVVCFYLKRQYIFITLHDVTSQMVGIFYSHCRKPHPSHHILQVICMNLKFGCGIRTDIYN